MRLCSWLSGNFSPVPHRACILALQPQLASAQAWFFLFYIEQKCLSEAICSKQKSQSTALMEDFAYALEQIKTSHGNVGGGFSKGNYLQVH